MKSIYTFQRYSFFLTKSSGKMDWVTAFEIEKPGMKWSQDLATK